MREIDQISNVKKEIKLLEDELKESSAQLGGVFYDSGIELEDSSIEKAIDEYEKAIPELKKKMETLKSYNLTITEAEDGINQCNIKITELESGLGSILEKVGVELYCFIGEKELAYPEISGLYRELKDGELKSETLENSLYAYENSVAKKSILNMFSKPFKVRGIKKDISQNNRESLKKFRELGRLYTQNPKLIDEESNESILDVLEDYKKLKTNLRVQADKKASLLKRVAENEEKIKMDSNGVKLKTLYSQLEQEIVDNQNKITEKLVELGFHIAGLKDMILEDEVVITKLNHFKSKEEAVFNKNRELIYLEKKLKYKTLVKEIEEKEERIKIEDEHIALRIADLNKHKSELVELKDESADLEKWLDDNSI